MKISLHLLILLFCEILSQEIIRKSEESVWNVSGLDEGLFLDSETLKDLLWLISIRFKTLSPGLSWINHNENYISLENALSRGHVIEKLHTGTAEKWIKSVHTQLQCTASGMLAVLLYVQDVKASRLAAVCTLMTALVHVGRPLSLFTPVK